MPMLISSLVSTSSSAHKVSPHCRFFFLKPGPIKGKNRQCFVPSTTRGGRWYPPSTLLAKESVGKMDVDDVIDVLEEEILDFMKNSEKPDSFPSKKELVCAGRDDLVDAIVKQGGWLSLGWDSEEVEDYDEEVINEVSDNVPSSTTALESDALLQSIKSSWDDDDDDDDEHRSEGSAVVSFCPYDDSPDQSASSPGSSLKTPSTKHETGIEGMLSRLERQRDFNIGFGVREKHEDYSTTFSAGSNNGKVDWQFSRFSTDSTHKSFPDVDGLRNSDDDDQPQMWRSWSIQRAGFRDVDIEDIEIAPSEASTGIEGTSSMDMTSKDEIITVESGNREADNCDWNELDVRIEKINHDRFIRNRLQQLELEASAVLRSVRSNTTDEFASQKRYDGLEFWEVQDSEISKAEDKLRSTRAKLAVLEGKMALAIMCAQVLNINLTET
ncbi:protein PTST homolog 2, chloroplastic [Morus notabilis]|uniref:protein PTST homolog 2, chloroplastic n=1 Tax=Morus notabilis TaxID=981085 RepID=UPI000CED24A7|nr:protein PTST homolog 2, chloroplastic [Morus notabilis]